MGGERVMGSGAFESPLISHARMRGLFRALVEMRVLSRAAGRGRGVPRAWEACFVGTALDLKDGDLVSDDAHGWLVDHVRRVGARQGAGSVSPTELKKALRAAAETATEVRISAADRLLCAVGQAMALKAQGAGVVLAYAEAGALRPAEWARALQVANRGELPLVLVTLPGAVDLATAAARMKRRGPAVPVIPVDAGDTLALYRVTQETMVRARADGGLAIIECLDLKTDPVAQMGLQLVKKGVCTERWVTAVEPRVRRVLEQARG